MCGVGVSPGVGIGPVKRLVATTVPEPPVGERHSGDVAAARAAAGGALEAVAVELGRRAESARAAGRVESADVLDAEAMMARDPGLSEAAAAKIAGGMSAARAVFEAFANYRHLLLKASAYLAGRVSDLDDIRDRVLARLTGQSMQGVPESSEPFVLVAEDLSPADTAVINADVVLALVTVAGGPTSHTAIIARTMGIPAVVACEKSRYLIDDTLVLVDGTVGEVTASPDEATVQRTRHAETARQKLIEAAPGPAATADGKRIELLANIGGPADLESALANGAEGVGLYRTEFLFLDRADRPTRAEQVAVYKRVLAAFPGGKVVARTLDAGADKPLIFLPAAGPEPNPALGERGLRLSMRHPAVAIEQLEALAEAAAESEAKLWVMAPMVADVQDAKYFVDAAHAAGLGRAGVMVEIPAAALRARDLATTVEFFSIGTNDLSQYTYAADRQLSAVARLHNPWQLALLDLIAIAASAADEAGKPCGVCGEAAAEPALACVLVGLGITSLSMAAPSLPLVRAALARHSLEQCETAAKAARAVATPAEARAAARQALSGLAELGL